jgi:hypothetical protein
MKFVNFLEDMGERPSLKHSIDRKDNRLGYTKENCRWVTIHEQMRNRTTNVWITAEGKTMCVQDWAQEKGLCHETLRQRIHNGWDHEKAVTQPTKVHRGL